MMAAAQIGARNPARPFEPIRYFPLEYEVSAARVEGCCPLFDEWLKVANVAAQGANASAVTWPVAFVLSETVPGAVAPARGPEGRNATQHVYEPGDAMLAILMPSRPNGDELVDCLKRIPL